MLIISNDKKYGGAGGSTATMSKHQAGLKVALHEVGHSFGKLADEYDYGSCRTKEEPTEVNITVDPTGSKWKHWRGTGTINDKAYEGGNYCSKGV